MILCLIVLLFLSSIYTYIIQPKHHSKCQRYKEYRAVAKVSYCRGLKGMECSKCPYFRRQ